MKNSMKLKQESMIIEEEEIFEEEKEEKNKYMKKRKKQIGETVQTCLFIFNFNTRFF